MTHPTTAFKRGPEMLLCLRLEMAKLHTSHTAIMGEDIRTPQAPQPILAVLSLRNGWVELKPFEPRMHRVR